MNRKLAAKFVGGARVTRIAGACLSILSTGVLAATDPIIVKTQQAQATVQAINAAFGAFTANQGTTLTANNVIASFDGGSANRFALTGSTGAAAAPGGRPWNAWVAYSQSKVGYTPMQANGTVDVGVVGVDYALSSNVILGVALSGDRTRVSTGFNGGSLNGNGYTISPYIGVALSRSLTLDATIGTGRTKQDLNVGGGVTGSLTNRRTLGSVGLSYRHQGGGNWQFTGRGALLAVEDRLGAFTLSNGGLVADGTVSVTQMRLSGQAGYKMGAVTPYVGLTYVYDIHRPNIQPFVGQTQAPTNDRDAWTPVIGLRFNSAGSLYGGIQYSSEQSRSQVKNNQLLFNLGIRF